MKTYFKEKLRSIFLSLGYEIKRVGAFEPAMEQEFREIAERCRGYHAQSVPRLYALYQAVRHVVRNRVEGAIVECGVFKGATHMLAGWVLKAMNDTSREFYLYDTYEGWPEPDSRDTVCGDGGQLPKNWNAGVDFKSLPEVRLNVLKTGYPESKIIFVKGKVEETLPGTMPEKISILRLDTDWYESTYHELVHLFPRLVPGGVLIVDDYGHWQGAKEAVDRYFSENKIHMLLGRVDYTGRMGIKV